MPYQAKKTLLTEILGDFEDTEDPGDFLHWVYEQFVGLDEGEIPSDEFIEGSGEKQLDVIRVEDDTDNRKAIVRIFQTKKTSGFSANTVVLIANGLSTLIESTKAQLLKLSNKTLRDKALEIREILKLYGYDGVEIEVCFVTLGDTADIAKEAAEAAEKLRAKWEPFGFHNFRFEFVGAEELYDLWQQKTNAQRKIDQDISIVYDVNRASIIEYSVDAYKAVVCTVSGEEIARLAALDPTDAIFDKNVRGHLGTGGRVNASILATCQKDDDAKTFWFKNNGITMVCKHLDVVKDPDEPVIKVKDVQIINGCQTSITLREAENQGVLNSEVRLLAKIYEIDDGELINRIVLATNNQNSIISRDLFANDECQVLIQERIASKLKLFYERKRGEAKSKDQLRANTIDSEKAGQAYLAIKKKLPTISRAQKYRIYDTELYDDIFKKADPLQLALCYGIYEFCKKRGTKEAKALQKGSNKHSLLTYGVFHLSRVFAHFLFLGENLPSDEKSIVEEIGDLRSSEPKKRLDTAFNKAVQSGTRILTKANAASANNYFKSQLSQDEITKALNRSKKTK
jgi:hypothetical protein